MSVGFVDFVVDWYGVWLHRVWGKIAILLPSLIAITFSCILALCERQLDNAATNP